MALAFASLTPAHLPRLQGLCEACFPEDPFNEDLLCRHIFGDPRFEPALAVVVERDGCLAAVAVSVIRTVPEDGRHGWLKLLAVDPGYRGRGLAKAMIDELENRFRVRQAVELTTLGAPYYFWPGVEVRRTPACCLFERLGFKEERYTVNMTVDLAGQTFDTAADERRLAREGFAFHRSDAASLPAVNAFVGRHWRPWCDETVLTLANDPVSMFHALRDGEVVAFAAYDAVMFRGTFGPMGTDPSLRGKGIGDVLLKKCFRDMKDFSYPRAEIAWVGPVGFYAKRIGAVIHRVFRVYGKGLG
ncbi:MAG: GNAT family N-acetyltransferase [Phycisphaerae bacterium]|nr:GNAT family N-acetyltransferase [Phycisphaerae bacterium]